MNERFDVAAIAAAGRTLVPSGEPDGIGTPADAQRVTRAARLASRAGTGPRPPEFALGEPRPQTGEAPPAVYGSPQESPEAVLSSELGDVPFSARDHEDRGPSPTDEGEAGGVPDMSGRP